MENSNITFSRGNGEQHTLKDSDLLRPKIIFLIFNKETKVLHGAFYDYDKATEFINGSEIMIIQEVKII